MKNYWLVLGVLLAGAVHAGEPKTEDVLDMQRMQAGMDKANDTLILSLANTAATIGFCGEKEKADELRIYMKNYAISGAMMDYMQGGKKKNAEQKTTRSMQVVGKVSAAMGADVGTTTTLEALKGSLSAKQKKTLCDEARKTYDIYRELRMRAKAAGDSAK